MNHYPYSVIILLIISLVISLTFARTSLSTSIKDKLISRKNDTQSRLSVSRGKIGNITTSIRGRFKPSNEEQEEEEITNDDEQEQQLEDDYNEESSANKSPANVVVLTSLSGVYVWWPILFGGDDSFHLLLSQEDVPRFHDVASDEHGHIYLTAPHERTVYRLQYADGWWISNFSNHSVMNSIRSEMPLFLNIHQISSILYVYGHSDIQTIDLLQRPRTRGSAPFMKRLRELSPNLRISDLIIDQLTSDGYIIGDSFGWCTVIRCALGVNECDFLFKIPSSYDNRPYPCTATIDFANKIMYLSLEEKILGVHLNEQTNYDRRFVLTEKRGPRSTLGYDDIIAHNNTILYTDVLRPLLHICTSKDSNPCLNISLAFPSPQRTILPLRLDIIHAPSFRPPTLDEDDEGDLHVNQSTMPHSPSGLLAPNKTTDLQSLIGDRTTIKSPYTRQGNSSHIWMLVLGVCIGLLLAGLTFMVYYVIWNKNRPKFKTNFDAIQAIASATGPFLSVESSSTSTSDRRSKSGSKSRSSDSASNHLIEPTAYSSTNGSSEWTTITTSSSSYRPDIIL